MLLKILFKLNVSYNEIVELKDYNFGLKSIKIMIKAKLEGELFSVRKSFHSLSQTKLSETN